MIASIGGGSGFGGAAGYCLGGGGGEEQEEERQPGLGGGAEEKREREETAHRSARDRQQEQASSPIRRDASRRREDEERKRRAREREREKKAAKQGAKRVLWTETRNLATNDVMRGSRIMEATARDAPVLKKLAGVKATGRKLKKPVVHYSLSWAKDERPERREMQAAVDGSLKALSLQDRQALVVAHGDTAHPHVHVIVNRVNPETGKAANMGRDRIKLSKWARRLRAEAGADSVPPAPGEQLPPGAGGMGPGEGEEPGPASPGKGADAPGDESSRSGPHLPGRVVEGRGTHPLGAGFERA